MKAATDQLCCMSEHVVELVFEHNFRAQEIRDPLSRCDGIQKEVLVSDDAQQAKYATTA